MMQNIRTWVLMAGLAIGPLLGVAAWQATMGCPCGDACPCGESCPCGAH